MKTWIWAIKCKFGLHKWYLAGIYPSQYVCGRCGERKDY